MEEFIGSDQPLALNWIDAVGRTFESMPRLIAVGRNITMFRTLEWMMARRAGRLLTGSPSPALAITTPPALRTLLFEVALGIVANPPR